MRDRTAADDIVQGAANRALIDLILPPMRIAAKGVGYAVTVHGSLNRDIDLVAVPWTETAKTMDRLVSALCGAVAAVVGNCHRNGDVEDKPHGRKAQLLLTYCGESHVTIDLSVMPTIAKPKTEA